MNALLLEHDLPVWLAAKPWLNVRSNGEHTLISYRLARALLRVDPGADERVVLTAILLHDTGWKMFPEEVLAQAVGPAPKYPELQRAHEIESARIARTELERLAIPAACADRVIAIIDGHDTRPLAHSLEDALMKDADKLWRFTAHGIVTLCDWFGTPAKETVAMLESFVLPKLITTPGKTMAQALLAEGAASAWMEDMLALEERV
jgi:HD domain